MKLQLKNELIKRRSKDHEKNESRECTLNVK